MLGGALLPPHQVALRLGLQSAASFHRRRPVLEAEHGFPPPVPGLRHRWDPLAIEAWLARQRPVGAAPADPVAAGEAELIRRAGALHAH